MCHGFDAYMMEVSWGAWGGRGGCDNVGWGMGLGGMGGKDCMIRGFTVMHTPL